MPFIHTRYNSWSAQELLRHLEEKIYLSPIIAELYRRVSLAVYEENEVHQLYEKLGDLLESLLADRSALPAAGDIYELDEQEILNAFSSIEEEVKKARRLTQFLKEKFGLDLDVDEIAEVEDVEEAIKNADATNIVMKCPVCEASTVSGRGGLL